MTGKLLENIDVQGTTNLIQVRSTSKCQWLAILPLTYYIPLPLTYYIPLPNLFKCFFSLGSSSYNKDALSVLLFTHGIMLEWFLFHICASRKKRRAASDCWDDRGVLFIPSHFYRGKISAFNLVGKWTLPLTFWLHPHLHNVVCFGFGVHEMRPSVQTCLSIQPKWAQSLQWKTPFALTLQISFVNSSGTVLSRSLSCLVSFHISIQRVTGRVVRFYTQLQLWLMADVWFYKLIIWLKSVCFLLVPTWGFLLHSGLVTQQLSPARSNRYWDAVYPGGSETAVLLCREEMECLCYALSHLVHTANSVLSIGPIVFHCFWT